MPNEDSLQWRAGSCANLHMTEAHLYVWNVINEASLIDTTDVSADWGNWILKNTKIEKCFDTNQKKPKRSASRLLHVYLLLQRHGGHSVTWPNSAYLRLWTAAI